MPLSEDRNFFNKCLVFEDYLEIKGRQGFISNNGEELAKLRESVTYKLRDLRQINELVCQSGIDSIYSDGELDIDKVMCLVVENSRISIGPNEQPYSFNCGASDIDRQISNQSSGLDLDTASRTAALSSPPTEQKPLPTVIKRASESPIGLTPALAKVDLYVPSSGSIQEASSESTIASGAVRSTISTWNIKINFC